MLVKVSSDNSDARVSLKDNLKKMSERFDLAPVTRQHKLRLFKQEVCPHLSWPHGWIESCNYWQSHSLRDGQVCPILPTQQSCTFHLREEVLVFPLSQACIKTDQSICMTQLFCSTDAGILLVAKLQLQDERGKRKLKFKPVDDLRAQDPQKMYKDLARAAKAFLATEEADERSELLCSLPAQGDMTR